MSEQYLRAWSLTVSNSNGDGLDLSPLKIRFAVRQADIQTPNSAYVKIYNLSETTRTRILQNEFTRVTLTAGYQDVNTGLVFDGSIKYHTRGRDNATDVYVELMCADGDPAYNWATILDNAGTLAAGSVPGDQVAAALQAMNSFGITEGFISDMGATALSRGKVMYGMARDVLRTLTRTYGVSWSIQNGKLQIVNLKSYLPGQAVVLTSATGLIGMPRQELDGIHIRCLMNPNIKCGQLIKLDNASIIGFLGSPIYTYNPGLLPEIADDGVYRTYVIDHTGDTRGQEWYTDLICLSNSGGIFPEALVPRVLNSGAF